MAKKSKDKEVKHSDEPRNVKPEPKYRLYCEACTNVATTGDKKKKGGFVVCRVCGKQTKVKKQNWLKNYAN